MLPAFGYATYYIYRDTVLEAVSPGPVKVTDHSLENDFLLAELDPATGLVTRLLDKRTGRELAAAPIARPVVVDDTANDTWAHGVFTFDKEIGEFAVEAVSILEEGPIRGGIRVVSRFGRSSLTRIFCWSRDRQASRSAVSWTGGSDISCPSLWRRTGRPLPIPFRAASCKRSATAASSPGGNGLRLRIWRAGVWPC